MSFISGAFIAGMWWFVLGLFLRGAAQMSFQQLLVRRVLEGEPIRNFMQDQVKSVPPDISIRELVDDHIYSHHHKLFPVRENGNLLGYVTTRHVRSIPREQWDQHTVKEITQPADSDITVSADEDAMQTLLRMNRTGSSRVLVVENDQLVGIVSLKDLMKFLSLKLEIEEDIDFAPARKAAASS